MKPSIAVTKPTTVSATTIIPQTSMVQRLRNTALTLETTAVTTSTLRLAMNGSENTEAAKQIQKTNHWTWEFLNPDNKQRLGKRNILNNFCSQDPLVQSLLD